MGLFGKAPKDNANAASVTNKPNQKKKQKLLLMKKTMQFCKQEIKLQMF